MEQPNETQEELSIDSDNERQYDADDEPHDPEDISDIQGIVNEFQEQEHWNPRQWRHQDQSRRYESYRRSYGLIRRLRERNRPAIIPFDESDYAEVRFAIYTTQAYRGIRLLDRTIMNHRVRDGILELEVHDQVQSGAAPEPRYARTHQVPMIWEFQVRNRMDERGFPRDAYQGRRLFTSHRNRLVGWYPLQQLIYTCPDLVMTYFLRARPMEDLLNVDWHLWAICYDIIRTQEAYPPIGNEPLWQHLDLSDFSDHDENDDDSDVTLTQET
jgi:hypothetical protein